MYVSTKLFKYNIIIIHNTYLALCNKLYKRLNDTTWNDGTDSDSDSNNLFNINMYIYIVQQKEH